MRMLSSILTNARCLTEGIDIPETDLVAFLSPKKSKVDIVQAAGRVMRKSKAKPNKIGYILIPLYVDIQNNESIDSALERTDFDTVWDILLALREQDEILYTTLSKARGNIGLGRCVNVEDIEAHLQLINMDAAMAKLRSKITTAMVMRLTNNWDEFYRKLQEFYSKNGWTNVFSSLSERRHVCSYSKKFQEHVIKPPSDDSLAKWINAQRSRFRNNTLTKAQREKLNEIGFIFDPSWFERLLATASIYGWIA